jgi:hypothetical protein
MIGMQTNAGAQQPKRTSKNSIASACSSEASSPSYSLASTKRPSTFATSSAAMLLSRIWPAMLRILSMPTPSSFSCPNRSCVQTRSIPKDQLARENPMKIESVHNRFSFLPLQYLHIRGRHWHQTKWSLICYRYTSRGSSRVFNLSTRLHF